MRFVWLSFFNYMNKKVYLYSLILCIVASLICAYFNWRISTGIVIGMLSSFLYFYILNMNFKIKDDGTISKGSILGFLVRILALALPLFIAFLLPNIFNFFGAFAGVMLFRIVMITLFFKEKGEM